jgi:hypothetical protein
MYSVSVHKLITFVWQYCTFTSFTCHALEFVFVASFFFRADSHKDELVTISYSLCACAIVK